jgi:hypothetical protein
MTVTPLGLVSVATPGTPVPLTTDKKKLVSKLFVQVIPGLSGKGYLGQKEMNRANHTGVIRILWPNAAGGFSDSFLLESTDGSNSIPLSQYYIDMDVAGEGLLVTYWTV